ncbi:MAG: hypothetical protein RLZZ297_1757, partial [Chloroflexota bacterium]
ATLYASAKANELLGVENRKAYTTGHTFTGTGADEKTRIDRALVDGGYTASAAFEDFYGADRGVYKKGTQRVIVIVFGPAAIKSDDWSYLADEVAADEGLVFYLFFPE